MTDNPIEPPATSTPPVLPPVRGSYSTPSAGSIQAARPINNVPALPPMAGADTQNANLNPPPAPTNIPPTTLSTSALKNQSVVTLNNPQIEITSQASDNQSTNKSQTTNTSAQTFPTPALTTQPSNVTNPDKTRNQQESFATSTELNSTITNSQPNVNNSVTLPPANQNPTLINSNPPTDATLAPPETNNQSLMHNSSLPTNPLLRQNISGMASISLQNSSAVELAGKAENNTHQQSSDQALNKELIEEKTNFANPIIEQTAETQISTPQLANQPTNDAPTLQENSQDTKQTDQINTNLTPIVTVSQDPLPAGRANYKGPRPVVLLILDGWGIGPNNAGNAIARAKTPNLTKYWMSYPHTQLEASGTAVGLPQGEDGNTETGHLNIGAGHIVYQDLPRINMSIADGGFFQNEAFLGAINHAKANNSRLHLMGLIGAGGVHSNIEHLYALLNLCAQQQFPNVYIHGFTDGRDSPPTSGINYVQEIMNRCEQLGVGKLASLMGRYFAMDRDKRWERIEKAYNALLFGDGNSCILNPIEALQQQYDSGITDEFIEPITICDQDGSHRVIQDNDAVIFFNYRIDRPRELSRAFCLPNFESGETPVAFDPYTEKYEKTNIQKQQKAVTFQRKKILQNLNFVTMTMYEDTLPAIPAFPPQRIKDPLGKVFADAGLRQLRTTETEKERFVSYYMNGQTEVLYPGEERVTIPSKGVKSYDQAPEMSAREITHHMLQRLETGLYDVVISNICNGDMVGHTGNLEAAIKACEIVDEVVGLIVEKVLLLGGMVFITADHGNVEEMVNNSTGEIDTEHSIYPVPFYIIGKQFAGKSTMLPTGILADVAPTILHLMGIAKPPAMTGRALL